MAAETKRRLIGVEVCKVYCELARKRLTYDSDILDQADKVSSHDFEDLLI